MQKAIVGFNKNMISYNENQAENDRYDMNKTRLRHGYKYTKYKMCLSMMMVICNKQHLRKGVTELKERVAYEKSVYLKITTCQNSKGTKRMD